MATFEVAEALDFRPGFDGDAGPEDDIGADDGVASDEGIQREEDGVGGGQGDAVLKRLGAGAGLEFAFRISQLRAGVDAEGLGFRAEDDSGGMACGAGEFDDLPERFLSFAR